MCELGRVGGVETPERCEGLLAANSLDIEVASMNDTPVTLLLAAILFS